MSKLMSRYCLIVVVLVGLAGILAGGCQQKTTTWSVTEPTSCDATSQPANFGQYDLLAPATIEILPFSKPRSFDDDQIPDGIEVVLRPLDSFGDQTKAVGLFRFELYLFQKASAEPKGARIGFWEENLSTREAQLLHWDRITRTYRFRLSLAGQAIKPGKYVLETTYLAPTGQRLTDTYIIEATVPREQLKENIEKEQQSGMNLF
jgi:hypothetical protein